MSPSIWAEYARKCRTVCQTHQYIESKYLENKMGCRRACALQSGCGGSQCPEAQNFVPGVIFDTNPIFISDMEYSYNVSVLRFPLVCSRAWIDYGAWLILVEWCLAIVLAGGMHCQ